MHKANREPDEIEMSDVVGFYKKMITTVATPSGEPKKEEREKSLDGSHVC